MRKLTETDKQEILTLYRETNETTSTLAERYNVSSSTISRFLKSNLSEPEYESLIQVKRLNRPIHALNNAIEDSQSDKLAKAIIDAPTEESEPIPTEDDNSIIIDSTTRRTRKRVMVEVPSMPLFDYIDHNSNTFLQEPEEDLSVLDESSYVATPILSEKNLTQEDLLNQDEDWDDDDEDDEDDDDDEDDEDDEDYLEDDILVLPSKYVDLAKSLQVLPLKEANLPKICYLVIDKSAELIAKPLKEFNHLGKIPPEEFMERTLCVFDNHRVAKRFSHHSHRVIKIPDSRMLYKVGEQLQAKGITRLLIDGQVYSL